MDNGEEGLQTEGAVAKYMATESGNKAAEDAIQALGGYGYTKEYMVEKIKRDVRITCMLAIPQKSLIFTKKLLMQQRLKNSRLKIFRKTLIIQFQQKN